MTKLIHRSGDLFTSDAPALCHGVNVQGVMGAGIAKAFRAKWPEMFVAYREECLSYELQAGEVFIWDAGDVVIYNAASQRSTGPSARYCWLESSIAAALDDADARSLDRIAMPLIGCGIGGLSWERVEPILERLAAAHVCDLEVWTL